MLFAIDVVGWMVSVSPGVPHTRLCSTNTRCNVLAEAGCMLYV